jgi:hypothetical protein
MPVHSVKLIRSAQTHHNVGNLQGYRYTVTAYDAVGMPNEIFRMYEQPLDPIAQTRTSVYDGVALPEELVSLPINAPVGSQYHYRVASIDVNYSAVVSELHTFLNNPVVTGEEQWEAIKSDVEYLVRSLAASDRLVVEETVQFTAD